MVADATGIYQKNICRYKADELNEKIYSKHFKSHCASKPTKRYLQLLKKIDQSEQLTVSDFHTLFR